MINLFIAFVDEQQEEWKGWVYAAILVLISLGKSFFDTRSPTSPYMFPLPRRGLLRHQVPDLKLKHVSLCRYWNGIELLSMRVFTALSAAVYKKSLTLSSTGRNQYTAGQVLYNKSSGSFGSDLFPLTPFTI